jgi:Transcriptional regulator PadR-like family
MPNLLDKEVKRGSTEMLILALVEDRPRHDYEIAKLIEERSDGVLQFHPASLYPLLYRMEKRGLIKAEQPLAARALQPPLELIERRRSSASSMQCSYAPGLIRNRSRSSPFGTVMAMRVRHKALPRPAIFSGGVSRAAASQTSL